MLLTATAALYLWGLGASGWANAYYAAAAQAGGESWQAFFFGSFDAAGAITVDKTPLSLWPMALSVRVFGLSSWALLVPQALEGVATVALLHALVRRVTGSQPAALVAGAILALTPVATLMFRFDNPDALLVLLLVGAAYATLRAVEASVSGTDPGTRWLVLAGTLVGLGFLTKMLQAFLVLPALGLAYLLLAGVPLARRLLPLLAALGSVLLAAGWWVAVVELLPSSARPYIGGSQSDSVLELTLGYNGLGRLTGDEVGSVGGGNGWGEVGPWRMFGSDIGGQIAWLLPAALLLGVAALWFARRGSRPLRAALVLWLIWLLVTTATFSAMAGIFHSYYTVALAPAIAALVGIGGWLAWQHRTCLVAAGLLATATLLSTSLAVVLLGRSPDFLPWLRYVVGVAGVVAALLLLAAPHLPRRAAAAVVGLALVTVLAGPAAYSLDTAATPHTGSIPSAGPTVVDSGPGNRPGRGGNGGPGGAAPQGAGAAGGGAGGLLEGSEPTAALTAVLAAEADAYTWTAAAVGANSAAGYQLATETPVLAIGGFNGSDPSPTLAQFQELVADGEVHWFIAGAAGGADGAGGNGGPGRGGPGGGPGGGRGGGPGGGGESGTSAEITAWVEQGFTATTVDGITLYDLSEGAR